MCFFVGNDFLPHLPSLEIRENAIDRLVKLYKRMVYKAGGLVPHFIYFPLLGLFFVLVCIFIFFLTTYY